MIELEILAGERSLARSFLYRILAGGLRYPESKDVDVQLLVAETLEVLGALVDTTYELTAQLAEVRRRFMDTPTVQLEDAYIELFGHSVRGTCPPYESEYGESRGTLQLPHELSDINAFYRAFSLRTTTDHNERVDHIAVECEFMHFLTFKQSHAEEHCLNELADSSAKAQALFLRAHLARWSPAFFRRVMQTDTGGFYKTLARLGLAFIKSECALLSTEPGSEKLRLIHRTETRDDVFDCGRPTECPGSGTESTPSMPRSEDGAFRV